MTRMSQASWMNGFQMTLLVSSLMGLAACSPNAGSAPTDVVQGLAASCGGQQKMIAASELGLYGKTQAASGEMVVTSLNQDLGCTPSSEVQWKIPSAKVVSQDKNKLVTTYSEPGRYLVEAKVTSGTSEIALLSQSTLVLDNAPSLEGPQAALPGMDISFHIAAPAGMDIASVAWSMGDGTNLSGLQITHNYEMAQVYSVIATVKLKTGASYSLKQNVTVIDYYDDFGCLPETQIFAPQAAEVGKPVDFAVTIPSCLKGFVSAVRWNFADGTPMIPGVIVSHAFENVAVYEVKADIYSPLVEDQILFSLSHKIAIQAAKPVVPPAKCQVLGEKRSEFIDLMTQKLSCGVDGQKENEVHTKVTYECQFNDPIQDWVEISRASEIKTEGQCLAQACVLADGSKLKDGESRTFFQTTRPVGACSAQQEVRSCVNGVLQGSTSHQALTCEDGCPGFGISGTKKSGIVIGEIKSDLTCQFGETGFFDLFHQIEDRTCQSGSVVSSNQRQGAIKVKGACPVYSWVASDTYTSCSENCGGKQSQIFNCRDGKGDIALDNRCAGAAPKVERVCDGNPDAVKRDDVTKADEEATSSNKCPKNEIGVILKSREIVTTKSYACVDHAVKMVSEKSVPSAWVEEKYCREYVAYRCSHDSLSNTQAKGRFEWMTKCQSKVPVIKEFIDNFSDVHAGQIGIDTGSRIMYPTFMNASKSPEKPWIAPTTASASCDVPAKVYISAVCVSSCATPEQSIMTELKAGRASGQTFIEALTAKTKNVVTLSADSSLDKIKLESTAVSSWVTELVDTEHEILQFKMKSGGQLRLTPNHPLVAADGMMREARDFKAGDALIKMGGAQDQIVSVMSTKHFGKVYNLFTTSSELNKNLVITGGYVNGTAFYQNEGAVNVNRQILRKQLTRGVFSKANAQ